MRWLAGAKPRFFRLYAQIDFKFVHRKLEIYIIRSTLFLKVPTACRPTFSPG